MITDILNLRKEIVGQKQIESSIFGASPRSDIIKLVVDWQMLKAMSGTHKVKTVSEVSGTTKKPFKQKGTGNARQGSLRSVQMRGGGVIHGPVVRSHAVDLPKKVRKLGIISALSLKKAQGKLFILDSIELDEPKTSTLSSLLLNFNFKSFFILDDECVQKNFVLASRNMHNVCAIPQIGANVYDIIKYDALFISSKALDSLTKRLS